MVAAGATAAIVIPARAPFWITKNNNENAKKRACAGQAVEGARPERGGGGGQGRAGAGGGEVRWRGAYS